MLDLTNRDSILATFLGESVNTKGDEYDFEDDEIYEEDPEFDIELAEAIFMNSLTPAELTALTEDTHEMGILIEEGILSEKTIVKFDKKAKLERATQQAVLNIAREKKDRDFNKLIRVWKMRKALLEKLNKKYWTTAKQRGKQMVAKTAKSKSPTAKKVAARVK